MSLSVDVSQFKQFFDNTFPDNKWVVGGSFAIDIWCSILSIKLSDVMPNNIDILYAKMTPITRASIGNYTRKQSSPCSSATFENPGFTPINLTMSRNNIKYYEVDGIKVLSPKSLLSWYEDDPQLYKDKIDCLKKIIASTETFEFTYVYSKEQRAQETTEEPASKLQFMIFKNLV